MTLIIPTAIVIICNSAVVYRMRSPDTMKIYPNWLVLIALAVVNIGCGVYVHASF